MSAQTKAERDLATLLRRADDEIGDSLHMIGEQVEGSLVLAGDQQAGLAEMVFGYEIRPDCEIDEDGMPEEEFSRLRIKLEVRERGVSEGDVVQVTLPRDWNQPLTDEDDEALSDWFNRVGGAKGAL